MRSAPSLTALALRGAVAIVAAVVIGTLLVLRGTGAFDRTEAVTVAVPAEVGLITDAAPVRYAGVDVGRVGRIDAGPRTSTVHLDVYADRIDQVPADVLVRVVPRTFFGDVYIDLVPAQDATDPPHLRGGDVLRIDTGPDAVALYAVYARVADLLAAMEPERLAAAVGALAEGLGGRGERLGQMIDDLHSASTELSPSLLAATDATGQLAATLAAAEEAGPVIIEALGAGAELSGRMLDRRGDVVAALDAAADLSGRMEALVSTHSLDMLIGFGAMSRTLAVLGSDPAALTAVLATAGEFGGDAARVFQTGRFDITASVSLSEPLPYTYLDCPVYRGLTSPECAATASSPGDYEPVGLPSTIADSLDPPRQFPLGPPGDPGDRAATEDPLTAMIRPALGAGR